ncbi:MAG: hypothetical protein LBC70_08375, partial [Chitinispirillales bacterium]|nr:hypothetical protein [Chitinispirillales bacterium]
MVLAAITALPAKAAILQKARTDGGRIGVGVTMNTNTPPPPPPPPQASHATAPSPPPSLTTPW